MPRKVPLPDHLQIEPFRVRDARAAGVGEGRLRGRDLFRPFHGIRTVGRESDDPEQEFLDRCRAYRPLLDGRQHFSHLTAARLWGLPLADRPAATEPLHVMAVAPERSRRGRGVVGHRTTRQTVIEERYGLPVALPVDTWLQLAPLLPLDDLIIVGDALVHRPAIPARDEARPFTTLDALSTAIGDHRGAGRGE